MAPGTELLSRLPGREKKSIYCKKKKKNLTKQAVTLSFSSGLSLTRQMQDFLECVCVVLSINTVSKGSL